MTNFHIHLDDKFDELMKKKNIDIQDLIDLKTFIYNIYESENTLDDYDIINGFRSIEINEKFNLLHRR